MDTPRLNIYDDFRQFAHFHGIALTPEQEELTRCLFLKPRAWGKSTLIALLSKYDLQSNEYLDRFFNKINCDQYRTS